MDSFPPMTAIRDLEATDLLLADGLNKNQSRERKPKRKTHQKYIKMDAKDQSMLVFSSRTHAKWCNSLCIYALLYFYLLCFACFFLAVIWSCWSVKSGRLLRGGAKIRNCNGKEVPKFRVYGNRG